ncbi:MAG TPA: hypothetical protein VJR04_13000 [Terriglobales bacterium]|nr:hypothetical protein [Terriglobales bacterium]
MATAVQIEVRVDENATNTSLSKIGTSIKQLQADVTTATKNLADAQLQLGKAAEQGNAQAKAAIAEYEEALQEANEALRMHQTSLAGVTNELSHQVPQYAAASGAVRLLEGNLNNMIRPAERFLATTLGLGPALQAAFPIVGAVAMIGVVEQLFGAFEHVKGLVTGMTQDMKDYEKEVIDGSHRAFLAVTNQVQAHQRLNEVNAQLVPLLKEQAKLQALLDDPANESPIQAIANKWELHDVNKQINALDSDRIKLLTELTGIERQDAEQAQKDRDQEARDDEQKQHELLRRHQEVTEELIKLQDRATGAGLTGAAKLAAAENAEIDAVLIRMQKLGASVGQQMQAVGLIDKSTTAEMNAQRVKDEEEFQKLIGQIDNDQHKQNEQDTNASLKRQDEMVRKSIEEQSKMAQQQEREFARQQQALANDLYSTFSDLTSGHIGKLITDGFKRLFANILAQWLMTVDGIRNANLHGGAGGLVGALISSVFGGGSGSGGTAAVFAGASSSDFGSPNAAADLFSLGGQGSVLGFGPTDMLSLGGGIGGPLFGAVPSLSVPTQPTSIGGAGGVVASSAATTGISALFSKAGLAKLLPGAALMAGLSIGGPFGAGADAIGAAMLLANSGALGAAIAPILGPVAGGLFAYGLGSKFGPTVGALGGAGVGAAATAGTALLIGASLSPFTLGISALIGGLVGLFGGLFGGGPSKHSQADKYINSNVLPLIQQELTNYEGFRTDFATAINDLEQLKQSSYDQMRQQFGKDATNDEWNKYVVPGIGTAEDRIRTDEAERQRRGTLVFGAPQFAEGGIFPGGPMFGGAGMAVLHPMERVMTARATSMYGPELAAMEASAKSGSRAGGGQIHLHFNISSPNRKGTIQWLENEGGLDAIRTSIRRASIEGRWP